VTRNRRAEQIGTGRSWKGLGGSAVHQKRSSYTSTTRELLPTDGNVNFSALFYQDALALLEPLADKIASGALTEAQSAALDALRGQTGPTLAYAYGEEDRITFAARGLDDLISAGLPGLLGLGAGLGIEDGFSLPMLRLRHGAGEEDSGPVASIRLGSGRNSDRPAA